MFFFFFFFNFVHFVPRSSEWLWSGCGAHMFQCRNVLLIWIVVGQGPSVLAKDAVEFMWIFSLYCLIFSFSLFLRNGSI